MYSWTSANPHAIIAGVSVSCIASRPGYPVHPVHPCSIYSPSRLIFPVAGLGCAQRPDSQSASRAAASGPIHPVPLVAAQFPCDGAPVHPAGGNRMGPAEAEPGRLCRSIRVEEMARLCQCCAGGTPALPGGLPPMTQGYQGHDIADAFDRGWSLKVVHPYSCSFVSIGGSSSKMIGSFFLEGSARQGRGRLD